MVHIKKRPVLINLQELSPLGHLEKQRIIEFRKKKDKLSQEIIDLICGHLVSNDEEERLKLWTYRCLSRQWQAALERRAYASVSILSDDADDFVRKLNPDRARYVREVHFHAMSNHPEPLRENEAARYPRYGDDGGHVCAPYYQTALLANLTTIMKHMAKWEVEYPIFFSISGTYLRLNEKSLLKFPIIKNITTFSCIVKKWTLLTRAIWRHECQS
jgi:hypothetical protein